jgi:hypothetical protein
MRIVKARVTRVQGRKIEQRCPYSLGEICREENTMVSTPHLEWYRLVTDRRSGFEERTMHAMAVLS